MIYVNNLEHDWLIRFHDNYSTLTVQMSGISEEQRQTLDGMTERGLLHDLGLHGKGTGELRSFILDTLGVQYLYEWKRSLEPGYPSGQTKLSPLQIHAAAAVIISSVIRQLLIDNEELATYTSQYSNENVDLIKARLKLVAETIEQRF